MRLDKLLVELGICTRSQAQEYIRKHRISVDDVKITRPETKVDEYSVEIMFEGKRYRYKKYHYYIMNKPSGVITATEDNHDKTVMDVFREAIRNPGVSISDLSPVGRLDKDTVGLLIITNDGALNHDLLSPKKHVDKKYLVKTDVTISDEALANLETGVHIGEGELTLPATCVRISDTECYITIHEGKFHQIKRMFYEVGCNVVYLKRVSMGGLELPNDLSEGQVRELTELELKLLRGEKSGKEEN